MGFGLGGVFVPVDSPLCHSLFVFIQSCLLGKDEQRFIVST